MAVMQAVMMSLMATSLTLLKVGVLSVSIVLNVTRCGVERAHGRHEMLLALFAGEGCEAVGKPVRLPEGMWSVCNRSAINELVMQIQMDCRQVIYLIQNNEDFSSLSLPP